MKKTGLFKIIMFVLLGVLVLSWIFSASYFNEGNLVELGFYNIGFHDFFSLTLDTFKYADFLGLPLFLLSVGALYGVLCKTGKYRAWVERIANNLRGNEFLFLVIIAFMIASITAVFDFEFGLVLFFPLIISIILAMGYDKITALVTTIGSLLVGTIGSIFGYNTTNAILDFLSLKLEDGILFRVALFTLSFVVLMLFLSNAKKTKDSDKDETEDVFLGEKTSNKYSIVPIIVMFSVLFVLLVLGCTRWSETFGVEFFNNIHEKITAFSPKMPTIHITTEGFKYEVAEVAIFGKLFGDIGAFGTWGYTELTVICLISSFIIGLAYRISILESMAEGTRKMLKPVFMVLLAYVVLYFSGMRPVYPTMASLILGKTYNVITSTISMVFGSALFVDPLYYANYVLPQIGALGGDKVLVSLQAQGIYGLTMFIAPTSAFLVFGLSYLGVSYKEWIKRTWLLVLELLAVVLIVLVVFKFL